jgi:beta-lactamase class A
VIRTILLTVFVSLSATVAFAQSLADKLEAIARDAGGTVGLSATHLESGRRVDLRADQPFPMMSVFKLPIGIAVLQLVDEGKLKLEGRERIEAKDLRLGASPLADRWTAPGVDVPVGELLALMVSRSDNSACDRLLTLAGGGAAVSARIRALGIDGIRVDRPEGEIARDFSGMELPAPEAWTLDLLRQRWKAVPAEARRQSIAAYLADPRDTARPADMTRLIEHIVSHDVLTSSNTDLLMRLLIETPTVPKRIRGSMPADAIVAHKGGTSDNDVDGGIPVANDVGLITLPHDRGHIALSIFVKGSPKPLEQVEPVIARLARAIYDEWNTGEATSASR